MKGVYTQSVGRLGQHVVKDDWPTGVKGREIGLFKISCFPPLIRTPPERERRHAFFHPWKPRSLLFPLCYKFDFLKTTLLQFDSRLQPTQETNLKLKIILLSFTRFESL